MDSSIQESLLRVLDMAVGSNESLMGQFTQVLFMKIWNMDLVLSDIFAASYLKENG